MGMWSSFSSLIVIYFSEMGNICQLRVIESWNLACIGLQAVDDYMYMHITLQWHKYVTYIHGDPLPRTLELHIHVCKHFIGIGKGRQQHLWRLGNVRKSLDA